MLAGYETTSTALTYICYILAKHPDEQQKLIEEIELYYPINEPAVFHFINCYFLKDVIIICKAFYFKIEPNTDNVSGLEYLDMFIKESLRLYPIANPSVNFLSFQNEYLHLVAI